MTRVKRPIGKRLIRNIILVSTFFSVIATAIQLYSDYKNGTELMEIRLEQVKASSLDSLSLNLWQDNEELIEVQLKSLLSFHDITYVAIHTKDGKYFTYGKDFGRDTIEKEYILTHLYNGKEYELGTLTIQAALSQIRDRVKSKFYLIAITQTIKTFIVAFIILYIFSYMVTRHLYKLVEFSNEIMEKTSDPSLKLQLNVKDDELELLVSTLNLLHETVQNKLQNSEELNKGLDEANLMLERQLTLQSNQENGILVPKDDIKEIEQLLHLMKDSRSKQYDIEEIRKDLETLSILHKRAFTHKES